MAAYQLQNRTKHHNTITYSVAICRAKRGLRKKEVCAKKKLKPKIMKTYTLQTTQSHIRFEFGTKIRK